MNSIQKKYFILSNTERVAFWLVLVVALAMVAFSFITFPRAIYFTNFIQRSTNSLPPVLALLSLASAALIFAGRAQAGGRLFITGFTLGMVTVPVVISDLAFVAALLTFVVGTYLATLVLPKNNRQGVAVLCGLAAVLILVMDAHAERYAALVGARDFISPADLQFAWVLTGIIILIYGYFLTRQFPSFTLRNKLVVISLILAVVPALAVGVISNNSSTTALTKNADESLVMAASQAAAGLDFFTTSSLESTLALAKSPDFVALLQMPEKERAGSQVESKAALALSSLALESRWVASYALIDSEGAVITGTDPREAGQDLTGQAGFEAVLQSNGPAVTPFGYPAGVSEPSILFFAPVRDADGNLLGVLQARYYAAVVQDLLRKQAKFDPEGLFGLVVTEEDILLADSVSTGSLYRSIVPLDEAAFLEKRARGLFSERARIENTFVDFSPIADHIHNSGSARAISGEFHEGHEAGGHGQERAGMARLAQLPWYVVIGQPEEVLLAPVRDQARATLLVGLVAALLAIGFALLIAWVLTRPLTRLNETAGRLAGGDLSARAQVQARDEIGALAESFNSMAEQLSGLVGSLEQRVADRTRALVTSAEVSRRLSTIIDAGTLLKAVVDELQRSFKYYHVQIYLLDEQGQNLVLAAGSGEAGRQLLERRHTVPHGRGLVGRALETGAPVLVKDVRQAAGWLANPLLPNTRAEVAVPIAVGQQVLGVLDVQQEQAGSLQPEDAEVLQSIANQVAVALQNARRYQAAERQANREALISAIGQRIQATGTVEEALQVAAREVGRALRTDGVFVELNARKNGS